MSETVRVTVTFDITTKDDETAEELMEFIRNDPRRPATNSGPILPVAYLAMTQEWLRRRTIRKRWSIRVV